MAQTPIDQRIVDEFFKLSASPKTQDQAWLFGLIATFGLTPDKLYPFTWTTDGHLAIPARKRPLSALHPQWPILFNLVKKKPTKTQWKEMCHGLYCQMAHQKVELNVTDLTLAHRLRKEHYKSAKGRLPIRIQELKMG